MNKENNLNILKNLLNTKNNLDLNKIKNEIQSFGNVNNGNKYNYIQTLLYPEKYGGIKAPINKKIPTVTVQLRSHINIKTDPVGKTVVVINPFFLIDNDVINYPFQYVYNTYEGETTAYFFIKKFSMSHTYDIYDGTPETPYTTLIDQTVESCLYSHYRLVSASVNVKYKGSLNDARGVIGGGISFENINTALVYGIYSLTPEEPHSDILDSSYFPGIEYDKMIDKIRHMSYTRENSCLEGIRMLYFPPDNSFLNFVPLANVDCLIYKKRKGMVYSPCIEVDKAYIKTGFNWFIYIDDGIPESTDYIIELCCNFECIVTSKMLIYIIPNENDYMISEQQLLDIINNIRNNCINKLL